MLDAALRLCPSLAAPAVQQAPPLRGVAPRIEHPRVALMCDPGVEYVSSTLATWLSRGIAVPLCLSHPDRELSYVLEDAGVSAVLATPAHAERMHRLASPLGATVHQVDQPAETAAGREAVDPAVPHRVSALLDTLSPSDPALIVYTSGTTGRPKGALHTHSSLGAQVRTLNAAWEWSAEDRILHTLPLHHVHGIVNALYCPLAAGAAVEFLPKFSPAEVWARLRRAQHPVSVFMGVPTMYAFLLNAYDAMPAEERRSAAAAAARLRLTISGSAACPLPVMRRWEEVSGQALLERYGMTETGMILGNPLRGARRPGTVGVAFPGVELRLAQAEDEEVAQPQQQQPQHQQTAGVDEGASGELLVRSAQLFSGYWGRPEATAEAFDPVGFFRTGDTAQVGADGYYRLLGRTSVDVLKRGGYKISALAVESALLEHPGVGECAVVGLPDPEYGEALAAVIAPRAGGTEAVPSLEELRAWAADRLPPYSLPSVVREVSALPRNAMGKVNKKALRAELFPGAVAKPTAPAA